MLSRTLLALCSIFGFCVVSSFLDGNNLMSVIVVPEPPFVFVFVFVFCCCCCCCFAFGVIPNIYFSIYDYDINSFPMMILYCL